MSGPVFTDNAVDGTGPDMQIHPLQGLDLAECFVDIDKLYHQDGCT